MKNDKLAREILKRAYAFVRTDIAPQYADPEEVTVELKGKVLREVNDSEERGGGLTGILGNSVRNGGLTWEEAQDNYVGIVVGIAVNSLNGTAQRKSVAAA